MIAKAVLKKIREITSCAHQIGGLCQGQLTGHTPGVFQWCSNCGAFRVLQGQAPPEWTRPALTREMILLLVEGQLEALGPPKKIKVGPAMEALIKWQGGATDRYGDDERFYVLGRLTEKDRNLAVPEEHKVAMEAFRRLSEDAQQEVIWAVIEGDDKGEHPDWTP